MLDLLLYVDNILMASYNMEEIKNLIGILNDEFEMKDIDATKRILGMDIIG
jgi:hypothetical protein